MDSERVEKVKKIWGWTDEEFNLLNPKNRKLIEKGSRFRMLRLVAEVIESKNCIAGLKKGHRYVMQATGFLLPEESTCPKICLWALAAFVPFSFMLYDRIGEGIDTSEFWIDRIRCLDVGVDRGGYGESLFRLYCEKAPSLEG